MANLLGQPPQRAPLLVGSNLQLSSAWQIWFNQIANSVASAGNVTGGGGTGGTGNNGNGPGAGVGGGFALVILQNNDYGFKLDGVTDDSIALQNTINLIGSPATIKIISQKGIYINASVNFNSDQSWDMTECFLYRGPNCSIGTNGTLDSLPAANKPHLFANITAGVSTFDVVIFATNVTPAAGNQFQLRGQRDITGQVPEQNKEVGFINTATNTGISTGGGIKWIITTEDPVQNSYLINYGNDAYFQATGLEDLSEFLITTYSAFTSNVLAGAASFVVANAALFSIGDWVFVNDRQTVGSATGTTDTNPINNEVNRVVLVDTGSNTITLQQALHHSYLTAYNGGISLMDQVQNVRIIGCLSTFLAASSAAKNYGFLFRYTINSYIVDSKIGYVNIAGTNYGQYGEAFRMQNSFGCGFLRCDFQGIPNQSDYPSAEGYGIVQNGCTDCWVVGGIGSNARHDVLIQDGSCGWLVYGRHINNPRISGIDTHGINACDGLAVDCVINGGLLFSPDATQKAAIRAGNSSHTYGDHNNIFHNIRINGFALNTQTSGTNQGFGIDLVVESSGCIFSDIYIDGADIAIHGTPTSSHPTFLLGGGNIIKNVICRNIALNTVMLDGGTNQVIGGITLDNITDDGNAAHYSLNNLYSIKMKNSSIINSVPTSNAPAVVAINCLLAQITGNDFDGANEGIFIEECPGAQIINNILRNQIQSTVFKDNTASGNNNGYIYEGNIYPGTSNPSKSLGGSTGILKDLNFQNINPQTGTTYTFAQIDESNIVEASNASAQTYTIPTNSAIPFQIGSKIDIINIGAGAVTIAGAAGVTYAGSTVTTSGSIKKIAINTWI